MNDQITLRGEGGAEYLFELPLDQMHTELVSTGKLSATDDDSAAAIAGLLEAAADVEDDDDSDDDEEMTLEEQIDAINSHAEANALADEIGVTGFEEKKPGLAEKKQALLEAAADVEDDDDSDDDGA